MTSQVHIYRAVSQPAHAFKVDVSSAPAFWVRKPKRSLVCCASCRRLRWAGNCRVQVYYDLVHTFCAPGRGCKAGGK